MNEYTVTVTTKIVRTKIIRGYTAEEAWLKADELLCDHHHEHFCIEDEYVESYEVKGSNALLTKKLFTSIC